MCPMAIFFSWILRRSLRSMCWPRVLSIVWALSRKICPMEWSRLFTAKINKSAGRINGDVKVTQPKTANSVRTIFLPQETINLLIQEHSKHPTNPIMFPSPVTGKLYGPDCIGRLHKKLLKKAGITENIPFHGLRHTFATLAIQQGVDAKTISSILGHYSAGFTLDTYTHVTNEMQKEAAQRMGAFIAQAV